MNPTTAAALGVAAAVIGCLTAWFVLRGQLGQIKLSRENSQRDEVWKIVEERKGELQELKSQFAALKQEWYKQAERIDVLELQRIKDQGKIQEQQHEIQQQQIEINHLKAQVLSLGGSV